MVLPGREGGPSILDGPAAIARLIDRTRHTDRDNFPGSVPIYQIVTCFTARQTDQSLQSPHGESYCR